MNVNAYAHIPRTARVAAYARRALQWRLDGLSYARIGRHLHLSRQRIQQILSPPPEIQFATAVKAKGRCMRCGVFVGSRGHVHHKGTANIPCNVYNQKANLEFLCLSCHRYAHGMNANMVQSTIGIQLRKRRVRLKDISRVARVSDSVVSRWLQHPESRTRIGKQIRQALKQHLKGQA